LSNTFGRSAFLGSRDLQRREVLPGYIISIDEVKVNGEVRELSGKEYTCSDDGNCTRVNLYNQWVTSVPDGSRHADGDNSGLSATVLSVKDNEILSTLEITFTYSAP